MNSHILPAFTPFPSYHHHDDRSSSTEDDDLSPQGKNQFSDDIWVFPAFVKSGKHSYFVLDEQEQYSHKLIANFREEEVPVSKFLIFNVNSCEAIEV